MDLSDFRLDRLDRHIGILTTAEQERLNDAVITLAGCGGVNGWAAIALARLGCRHLRLADPGTFDASNVNRQYGSGFGAIDRNKAKVVAEEVHRLDPGIELAVFAEGVTAANVNALVAGADVVVDGIDLYALDIKKALYDEARAQGLAVVSGPILGFGAALAIFDPVRSPSFDTHFGPIPDRTDKQAHARYTKMIAAGFFGFRPGMDWARYAGRVDQGKPPSIGVACMLSGALTTTAVIDRVLGRNTFPVVPTTVHVDLAEQRIVRMGGWRRRLFRAMIGRYLSRIDRRG